MKLFAQNQHSNQNQSTKLPGFMFLNPGEASSFFLHLFYCITEFIVLYCFIYLLRLTVQDLLGFQLLLLNLNGDAAAVFLRVNIVVEIFAVAVRSFHNRHMVFVGRTFVDTFALFVRVGIVASGCGAEGYSDFRDRIAVLFHNPDGIGLFPLGLLRSFAPVDLLHDQRLELIRFSVQVIFQRGCIVFRDRAGDRIPFSKAS